MVVSDIRQQFAELYSEQKFVIDKSGVRLLEIAPANFIADDDHIFGAPNDDYIRREIGWYNRCRLNINDIEAPIPQIWQRVAGKSGYINSNYGWCIYHPDNYNQYDNCLAELMDNWRSRRAVMIYTRPTMHKDRKIDGADDFMCTNAVQYMIRDDKLHAYVQMRSNDAWAGYRNDFAWQRRVHAQLATDLEIELGILHWSATSLHIYEPQFKLVDKYINTGETR